jgi:putative addiction module antidote
MAAAKTMNITVLKIGNSEGVILPKDVLQRNHLKAGDQLFLIEESDGLKLRRLPVNPERCENKMKVARERMKKYETAYRVLAK